MSKKPTHVDELWEIAQAGTRRLTATERRRVLHYLEEIGETKFTNLELAKKFQVSDRMVRDDRKRMLDAMTAQLTPAHAMAFVGQHLADLNRLIATCSRGLAKQECGTLGETRYAETLNKLMKERRETLENIGVIRKELGHMAITEETWVAEVSPSGECSVGAAPQTEQ